MMGWHKNLTANDAKGQDAPRIQYAALCWRGAADGIEVLLITSRDTGRWVIPKGWPMAGLAPEAAAAQEAWEEAGVEGLVNPLCLGRFGYMKCMTADTTIPCAVSVYGLRVAQLATTYPEVNERRRQWFSLGEAALLVDEPDLHELIGNFVPPDEGRLRPIAAEAEETTPKGRGAR